MAVSALAAGGFNYGLSNAFTVSAGTNRMAVAVITYEATTDPTTTCTLGGTSLTDYGTLDAATGGGNMEMRARIFLADEATLTTIGTGSKTLLFTQTGGTDLQGRQCMMLQVEGASQSTPSAMVTAYASSSSAPTLNVSVSSTGAMVIGVGSNNKADVAPTVGAGFTVVYAGGDASGDNAGILEYLPNASAGTNAVTYTTGAATATRNSLGGFVIEPYSAGSSVAPLATLSPRTIAPFSISY
jgi:hypothetical protein